MIGLFLLDRVFLKSVVFLCRFPSQTGGSGGSQGGQGGSGADNSNLYDDEDDDLYS